MKKFCAALTLALLASSGVAHANSRLPYANQLVFAPDNPSNMLLRTTFGFLFSNDAGKTWIWMCEDAIPVSGQQDPAVALMNGGVVLSGQQEGLATSPDQGCSWSFVSGTAKELAIDVARTPDASIAIAATNVYQSTNDAGILTYQSTLLQTTDNAKSWQAASGVIDPTLDLNTLDIAPSDPKRIYLTGEVFGATQAMMLVSTDSGQSYNKYPIAFAAGETGAYIAAVDPTNEDLVYVRTLGLNSVNGQHVSRLLVSTDGGKTFGVKWSGDAMLGFALSQDGTRVYIGSVANGLLAANASDLAFTQISPLQIQCLATHGNTLYACTNEANTFAQLGKSFILAATTDEAKTFTPLLALETIAAPISCAAGTSAAICSSKWPALVNQLGIDAGSDAGTPSSSNGCGCSSSDSPSNMWDGAIFAGVVLGIFLTLRSRLFRAAR